MIRIEAHTTSKLRLAGTCGERMHDSHPWEVPEIWHYGTRAVTVELDLDCMAPGTLAPNRRVTHVGPLIDGNQRFTTILSALILWLLCP